jgi:RNA polymerase sigma-70 factor (ECF subfamily)
MVHESEQPTSAPSDEDLMAAIAEGDQAAFHLFFRKYSPDVLAVCIRILDDPRDAEDVLLDVFWEIWRRADRYDAARGNPRTYLMLLSRSRAIDRRRERAGLRERHVGFTSDQWQTQNVRASPGSPQSHLVASETRSLVIEAVESLDDDHRVPLELAFFEGLSHREIAKVLDSPLGTIKTRIRKGLARLRLKLKELDDARD